MKQITPKQRLFVHEYLVDHNATRAAIRAGYSKKSAGMIGHQLIKKTLVAKAVDAGEKKHADRLEITQDKWLRELASIYFAKMPDFMEIAEGGEIRVKTFDEMTPEMIGAIESIEENRTIRESGDGKDASIVNDKLKFKLHSKIEAGKLIGQHLGYLKDKIEIPGVERALYEISEKFMPAVMSAKAESKEKRSDGPK